mmetsp:Transcript_30786/g.45607  ORF Transcript_30786/g.45607 Transcript_30786/m.45607 type:complete len:402 (-) Transcript_30786:766-1971(-)|eukprot:CAMPEP_0194033720 /NCGR_PEP_ID=MMETSP0009_2-20130614/6286_1 /TAXON_ID=210454 /ORGANISM="Grammatophora oceanica, Strain CCMP 410" /LENGTH=401 /DNA_ID=CAMNT_0038674437 /DNA_START=72 /DNA_END=1277 /DNA_ORIENTATION=+
MSDAVEKDYSSGFLATALKQEILHHLVTQKANACPMGVRLAWHSSGTFKKDDGSGGSNGATMRFEPESTDGANAGLGILRDILVPVRKKFPNVSVSDIWAMAGAAAVEHCGGPKVPLVLGREDKGQGFCPENGRLPDASQGAQHLRDVFYRMGFNDQEIVALSGAHTLGRCHKTRSGFDGPWTEDPLKFDNTYFTNLLEKKWQQREWDGPLQYEDAETKSLMMLPTDIALTTDDSFKVWVEKYAQDADLFEKDFAAVFAKLLALGCPAHKKSAPPTPQEIASLTFREHSMHGSLEHCQKAIADGADPKATEADSGRTALHKAAFWGHEHLIPWFVDDLGIEVNALDYNGDTALHDAARFGHVTVIKQLLERGADSSIANKDGKTVADVATEYEKTEILDMF